MSEIYSSNFSKIHSSNLKIILTRHYIYDILKFLTFQIICYNIIYIYTYYYMEVFVLFSIGDKVVYPMQGTGIIERIEDKIFSGKNKEYIIVRIISNNLEIMIPSDKISNSNLRKISDNSTLNHVLFNLTNRHNYSEDVSAKERYQNNVNKIKSGSLKDSAEVVYDLMLINKEKSLNTSEKQLFNTARKFLIEEISLIKDISVVEATDFLKLNLN